MITAKINNPDDVEVTVTITKPLRFWKKYAEVQSAGKDYNYAVDDIRCEARKVIDQVEQTFWGEVEK